MLISKGAISLELQSEMKIFPGKRVDGNEDRREVRLGNVAMLLNIYCEIHEVCSLCVNKNIIIYLIKYRKQNSLSLNRLHPFLRYSGVASLLFQSTDPPWWYLLQS